MKKSLLLFLSLLGFTIGFAQTPTLVKDINTVHTSLGEVKETITYNGYVYFIQDDGTNGSEVWRTDGATTEMFTDIDNAFFGNPFSLTVWNGNLFFSTDITGVWKSDGTAPGTASFTTLSGKIIPAATKLYIFDEPNKGLAITDGVSGGDFISTLGYQGPNLLGNAGYNFTTLADGLFYVLGNAVDAGVGAGTELVYEDGNPANPPVVIDIYPGTDGSYPGSLTVYNNKLHFVAVRENDPYVATNNGLGAKTLFESDGTVLGTTSLVDFSQSDGLTSSTSEYIELAVFNSKLYYHNVSGNSTVLNTYDGTSHVAFHTFTNTNLIASFKYVRFDAEINGVLYFRAYDSNLSGYWQTDGAAVTTTALQLGVSIFSREHAVIPGQVIYSKHPNTSQELFSATIAGVETALQNFSNSNDTAPSKFTVLGTDAYFVANQDADGSQLWKTDGTTTTQISTNGIASSNGSNPDPIFELGGNLYFSANNGIGGSLYKTDGTEPNTFQVGGGYTDRSNGVELNNEYYYSLGNNFNDQLWKTDGTTFTSLFTVENQIVNLTASGSNIFYVAYTAAEGVELWVTDGTATHTVLDLIPGTGATQPGSLIDVNGTLYFQGLDINTGSMGLWESDGTLGGTTLLFSDINGHVGYLTRNGENLFFVVDDLFDGIEPQVYNTTTGLFTKLDLNDSGDSEPYGFQEMEDDMYFFTKSPKALWKEVGTDPEVIEVEVVEYLPSSGSTTVGNIFASSNALFYNYNNVQYAYNGSGVNSFTASINQPITIGNMVYYKSVSTKWELWETDGTTAGTKYIVDIASADKLFSFNDELYFAYDDGLLGKELHKYQSAKQGFALTINSALNVTENTEIDLTLDWTAGNGDGRIVLISTDENMNLPVDGETYTANTVYGSSALGSSTNTFVIGNGSTATTGVTGLTYGTSYYMAVIEYTEPTPGNFLYDRQSILRGTYDAPKVDQTITLTAIPAKTYGDANFPVEATSTSGQTVTYTIVSGPGTFSGNTLIITGAGDIVFDADVAEDATYNAATMQTTVPVAKVPLTGAVSDESKTYGAANPLFTVTYNGFIGSEDATVLDSAPIPSTTADVTSNVGSYDITLSTGSDNNYEITNVEGALTVTKAALDANVSDASKTYGEANPIFTVSYTGFANGEDDSVIDTAPTVSTTADQTTSTGSFAITATGGVDANYDITSNDGILTINKASLSAVINDQERQYGEQNEEFTFTYTGFVNNDTNTALDSSPVASTLANNVSNVGTYAINASNNGSDNNYTISTPTSGTLTILKADQVIALDAIADQDYSISDQVTVASSISSSLQITLSVTGPATVDGSIITLDATTGTVVVTASQAGDSNHNAATEISVSFEAFTSDPCFNFEVTLLGSAFNACNGASEASIDIAVTGGDGDYTYSWSSGEATEDLANIAAGTYTITVTDGNNCSATVTTTITDPDAVETPVITAQVENQSQPFLIINNMSEVGYEWFKNGVSVQNGSSNQLFISEEGSYTVIAFNSIGCASAESEAAVIVITGFENAFSGNEISFYPNPVNDKLTLEMGTDFKLDKGAKVVITDVSGKEVYNRNYNALNSRKTEIDISSYGSGIYLVRVINGGKIAQYKVRKQ